MHADEEDYSERFSDLQIFPNPASGQVSLIWSQEHSAPVTILVYDVFGKEKIRIGDNAMQGANSIILDVSPLIPGNYLVEVKTNEITSTQRIVIIN